MKTGHMDVTAVFDIDDIQKCLGIETTIVDIESTIGHIMGDRGSEVHRLQRQDTHRMEHTNN